MSLAGIIAAAGAGLAAATQGSLATLQTALNAGGLAGAKQFAAGQGLDGIAKVKGWPGGWTATAHAANVFECLKQGWIAPWRWVLVQVDPRLVVAVMHDALSIGTAPHCRIPINQSGCQRLADEIGRAIGQKLLMPTPKISDAVHLHAAQGNGRAVDMVSIWTDPTEPPPPPGSNTKYQGQNVAQWLRQQERVKKAVAAAGGYPAAGVVSTVGKDVTLSPRITDHAVVGDASGESVGPKMEIYGWHTRQANSTPQLQAALKACGWLGVQQPESTVHGDMDNGRTGHGGFWDYSSTLRLVADDCILDGKPAKLTQVYTSQPELVYCFGALPKRPIPARYPLVAPLPFPP